MTTPAGESLRFTLWTDDVELAAAAARAGVVRIGPDLELIGKRERQPAGGDWISEHTPACLARLRPVIGSARLHVRVNSPHAGLARELETCLDLGVTSVMLPMVRRLGDARRFVEWVRGRAEVIVMVEHADALAIVDDLAALDGVSAIYVGANDLARSLGMRSRFGVLGSDLIAAIADPVHQRGLGFGFFGVARPDDRDLPVPSDLVYAEQVRLGATDFVLARTFVATPATIAGDLDRARARLDHWRGRPEGEQLAARDLLRKHCMAADRGA